jgi:hypothetical protein
MHPHLFSPRQADSHSDAGAEKEYLYKYPEGCGENNIKLHKKAHFKLLMVRSLV